MTARPTVEERHDRRKADALVEAPVDRGSQALVIGTYGHSRFRGALLGGTKQALLAEAPMPLLLAHQAGADWLLT